MTIQIFGVLLSTLFISFLQRYIKKREIRAYQYGNVNVLYVLFCGLWLSPIISGTSLHRS